MSPIVNLQLVVKCKNRSFHSFKVEVALLRYIVLSFELGCDTSEPHVSYISRACSSLVRQPYYAPNCFILKISGLDAILVPAKGNWDGRAFYMDEYTLIFLFSQCKRCAQKRYCWESVRFASERSRVRIPLGPLLAAAQWLRCCFSFCLYIPLSIYNLLSNAKVQLLFHAEQKLPNRQQAPAGSAFSRRGPLFVWAG